MTRKNKPGAGRKPKGEVMLTSGLTIRLTSSQKTEVMSVADYGIPGTASDFWRAVVTSVSQGVQELQSGKLTPEQFKVIYGVKVYELVGDWAVKNILIDTGAMPEEQNTNKT